jgi:iron complex outermembrane receptor protein
MRATPCRGSGLIQLIRSLKWIWCAGILTACLPALAQQAPPRDTAVAATPTVEEVVVTGSRIAAPNEKSTSPIQVISSQSIETTGRTDISDIINQLPQNFTNDLGQDLGNGTSGLSTPGGVATADLRGLGPNRTLVLVDGRRLGIGSPNTFIASPAPDLDQIPAGLIDRVEVVTGGASAAYGSDAIAGVINFIMKRNFEGFQVDGQWNENWHDNHNSFVQNLVTQFGSTPATGTVHDGRQRNFDAIMGANFADGKGNMTAYLSYRHADPVAASQRDFGGCQLFPTTDANGNVNGTTCGGSSNSNWFEPVTGPNAGNVYSVFGHSFVPRGSVATTPPADYNSQSLIYMTRGDDRYNAAFLAHDEIASYFRPYAEFYFMHDKTHTAIAPAALFKDSNVTDPTGKGDYFINCSNPLLSAQEQATLCTPAQIAADAANPGSQQAQLRIGRRNIEGGARFSDYDHQNYRAVFGTKGEIADAWSYDAYGQYYYVTFFVANQRYLSFAAIDDALLATGTAANPRCLNNSNRGCVPYDPFVDGGVTAAQLKYLYLLGTERGTDALRTLHADVTGRLGQYGITSPLANEGVGVNIGFEHRNESESFQPDSAEQSGLLSGAGSAAVPLDASLAVDEEFIEVRAPLVQDKPGAKELLFDTGYRRSNYTTAGVTNTYKFEVQYAPIADYRLRGSYDHAIRAPAIVELFNPANVGLIAFGNDPCAPPITYTLLQCERTGVTAAQYNSGSVPQGTAGQLSQETSGNAALKPERADTYTLGVNFAPSAIPHFSGSLDYYHIKVQNVIGVIPASVILANCANTGDPTFCSQIVRSPTTGGLTGNSVASGGFFIQKNYNLGSATVSGIDVQLAYRLDLAPRLGGLSFEMNGAYLQHAQTQPLPGGPTYDCAGYFGFTCQTVNPRWHHIFRTTWQTPLDLSVSATWRFIGPVSNDNNSPDPTLHLAAEQGVYDFFNARIPSYSYLDLEANWAIGKVLTLRAGVNNVTDKDPPLVNSNLVSNGAANTYSVYDMFGRQLFLAFTAKF